MLIECAEYDPVAAYWNVWGVLDLPGVTVAGVHTIEAPESATLAELADMIAAQYGA